MNTLRASFRACHRLSILVGLLVLSPAPWMFAQSTGSGESDSGTSSQSGTASGAETGGTSTSGDARADAMDESDARKRALQESDARARALQQDDARARSMQEDSRAGAMQERETRAKAIQGDDARSRALGSEGRTQPVDRMDPRLNDADRTGNGTRAVTDLPPGVTTGGGSAVTGGAARGTGAGDAALGDGMRMSDGSLNQEENGRRDPRTTARMIGEASFSYRDRAMTMAERELTDGTSLTSALQRSSANVSGAARSDMNEAIKRVTAARTEFAKAISRARSANESRWEDSRKEVVERYDDYVEAQEEALDAAKKAGAMVDEPGRLPAPPVLR